MDLVSGDKSASNWIVRILATNWKENERRIFHLTVWKRHPALHSQTQIHTYKWRSFHVAHWAQQGQENVSNHPLKGLLFHGDFLREFFSYTQIFSIENSLWTIFPKETKDYFHYQCKLKLQVAHKRNDKFTSEALEYINCEKNREIISGWHR